MSTRRHPGDSVRPSRDSRRTALEFRRGETAAVEEVRRYVRRILAFRRLGIDRAELPDLEQQVMTQLWQAATQPGFDPAAGFWGFVEIVTARRCIDTLRRDRPTTELPEGLQDVGRGPLDRVLAREHAHLANAVLSRLAAPCRELIELHAVRGLTYRAIAPILGKSEGALRVQMHRCIEYARRLIAEADRPTLKGFPAEENRA